jgi:hypothetical protein
MDSSFDSTYRAARWHYELGRLRDAVIRAAVVVLIVAAVTVFTIGKAALVWLPLTFAVAVFTDGKVARG